MQALRADQVGVLFNQAIKGFGWLARLELHADLHFIGISGVSITFGLAPHRHKEALALEVFTGRCGFGILDPH
ncbi:hypothetical protein D3C76_1730930 [compost metagenome]